jgi:hypothetical protein
MTNHSNSLALIVFLAAILSGTASAQEKPVVGLIPKARKPIKMDGKLDDWDGAFVTPVHVGHPDFANRGGQFLYLWDEKNLYIGLRCLDPAQPGRRCGAVCRQRGTGQEQRLACFGADRGRHGSPAG